MKGTSFIVMPLSYREQQIFQEVWHHKDKSDRGRRSTNRKGTIKYRQITDIKQGVLHPNNIKQVIHISDG